jgi:hypothetical protein
MIKTNYSSKLFFGKYSTKITVSTVVPSKKRYNYGYPKPPEVFVIHDWCKDNFEESYLIKDHFIKTTNDLQYHQMVYTSSLVDKNKLILEFGTRILEITHPLNLDHEKSLDVRNLVVVRKNLLFNKYKYSVYFKYDPTHETWDWLKNFFQDETDYKLVPSSNDITSYPVWPRIYLTDDTHLMSLKLMWQERIDYIKTVELLP